MNITTAKANRTLNFLKRNLSKCSSSVKEATYCTSVRPSLEYASVVWDPYHNSKINQLEKVQRRAASWVLNNISCYSNIATSPTANSSIASKSVQITNPF